MRSLKFKITKNANSMLREKEATIRMTRLSFEMTFTRPVPEVKTRKESNSDVEGHRQACLQETETEC